MGDETIPKSINRIRTFASDASAVQKNTPTTSGLTIPTKKITTQKTATATITPTAVIPPKVDPVVAPPKTRVAPVLRSVPVPVPKTFPVLVQKKQTPAKTHVPDTAILHNNVRKGYVDLSDEVSTISTPNHESVLSDNDDVFDVSQGTGTIIRDTKRKRFRLLPAMAQAVADWFGGIKTDIEKARQPKVTVAKAEARKAIIEAAVTQGQQAPKEDFAVVAKRMKSVERKAVTSTLSFKEKSEIPTPSWTHIANPDEETEKQEDITPTPIETKQELSKTSEVPVPTIAETPQATKKVPENITSVVEQAIPEERTPTIKSDIVDAEEPTPVSVVDTPIQKTQTPAAPRVSQTPTTTPRPNRAVFIVMLVAVIIGMSVLGVGLSYYFFVLKDAPKEQAVQYAVPSLVQAAPISLPLPLDRNILLSSLTTQVEQSQSPIEIYLTSAQSAQPATSQEILLVLAPQMSGSFARAIKTIMFGALNNEPFIVLKVTSFDAAFAGMLDWEDTASADLAPLFGSSVSASFDASARTSTQVRNAFFKDIIASNKNTRLLQDESANDRIVYTFVDQNTILITTTRNTLSNLLPLIK